MVLSLTAALGTSAWAGPGNPHAAKGETKDAKKAAEKPGDKDANAPKKKQATPAKRPQLHVTDPASSRRINLFPEKVFGKSRHTPEDRHRLTLGDDRNWKVQAAQVGAMAAVFGALVGLCGGGKCMIPNGAVDFLPGWMKAQPTTYTSPRREQPLREAH